VLLSAFLVQSELPASTHRPEIFHLHRQGRSDARKTVGEGCDQRTVTQIAHGSGRDHVDQPPPPRTIEHWRRTGRHDMRTLSRVM
jgi:hypothetical protein